MEKIEDLIRGKIPMKKMPKQVAVEETGFEEAQQIARALDFQKRKADPSFKGAFHEKKKK